MTRVAIPPIVVACALAGCVPGQRASYRIPTSAHRETIAASGIRRVSIASGVGDVRVTSTSGDSLFYEVALRSQDERRLREICIPGSRVERVQEAGVTSLRLTQSGRNQCGEVWTLRVPNGTGVHLTLRLGNATLDGTFGEVRVRGGSGPSSLRGTLASPSIDAELGHGTIDLVSVRRSHGSIELRTSNGDVELMMNGMQIPSREKRGAGASLALKGDGDGAVSLRSGLGDVKLRVEP